MICLSDGCYVVVAKDLLACLLALLPPSIIWFFSSCRRRWWFEIQKPLVELMRCQHDAMPSHKFPFTKIVIISFSFKLFSSSSCFLDNYIELLDMDFIGLFQKFHAFRIIYCFVLLSRLVLSLVLSRLWVEGVSEFA